MGAAIEHNQTADSMYIERELRSDHAGETGAVYIYKGIIAVAKLRKDPELIRFACIMGKLNRNICD